MDFKDYKVYYWTDKTIRQKFPQEILDKYYKQICYLYQNGFDLNCKAEEVEEQLSAWNFFKDEKDLDNLKQSSPTIDDWETGRKIISEELYKIVKETSFIRIETATPTLMKIYCKSNWIKIKNAVYDLHCLFNSNDDEIKNNYVLISNLETIREKITELEDKLSKTLYVISWNKFKDLIGTVYSTYIKLSKKRTNEIRSSIKLNLNTELYGVGGYNINTNEVKCIYGSAIWDIKNNYTAPISIVKITASKILKENFPYAKDNKYISFLKEWLKKTKPTEEDNDKARKIVVNCLLNGVFDLIMLRNEMNFLSDDKNNVEAANKSIAELKGILKYCGISKSYLL